MTQTSMPTMLPDSRLMLIAGQVANAIRLFGDPRRAIAAVVATIKAENERPAEQAQQVNAELAAANAELAQAVQALAIAKAAIEHRDAARVKEINAAMHDLRRNLQIIQSSAEILFRACWCEQRDTQPVGPYAEIFWSTLQSMKTFMDHMRDAMLLQHSQLDLRPEAIDLIRLIDKVQRQIHASEQAQTCHLMVSFEDIPRVWCDGERIERVLQNLVDNALKFTVQRWQGRPGGMVQIGVEHYGDQVVCHITDNGIGIMPEELAILGQPFVRGVAARAVEGMGLGLDFSKGVIQASKGLFAITSAGLNCGVRVNFSLPSARAERN
jgi:two-component system sensor histidine kinase KdpD